MERLTGETIPCRILRDERFAAVRPGLARSLGTILARIHARRSFAGGAAVVGGVRQAGRLILRRAGTARCSFKRQFTFW